MKKETIKPPIKRDVKVAARALPKGNPLAGRVMADQSVAVRQGAAKSSKKR